MKYTALIVLGILLLILLTGCGGQPAEADTVEDTETSEAETLEEVDNSLIDENEDIDLGEII